MRPQLALRFDEALSVLCAFRAEVINLPRLTLATDVSSN